MTTEGTVVDYYRPNSVGYVNVPVIDHVLYSQDRKNSFVHAGVQRTMQLIVIMHIISLTRYKGAVFERTHNHADCALLYSCS